ncbi:MAG TPA: hypothetical protein VF331_07895 [Polyangiales bacterium]
MDTNQRCSEHQEYDGTRCICATGYGLMGNQCVQCAAHEVGSLTGCACAAGYVRASDTSPCEASAALGKACTTEKDCASDAKHAHCQTDVDGNYCTHSGCAASS